MSEAERILNEPSMYDRLMPREKHSFWDHVFPPKHKLKRKEKHVVKTVKKEKHTIEEYYP